ncbi:hypothetical protein SH449x_000161 [Pirellulaceae bacterium SH449]
MNTNQRELLRIAVGGTFIGILIGNSVMTLKAMLPHGTFQKMILEQFCRPNNVSLRTVERYVSVAKSASALITLLRKNHPEYEGLTDEEVLKHLPLTQAYDLVKKLSRIELEEPTKIGSDQPRPCPNGWVTPKPIVDSVLDLLRIVDVDPCAIGTNDPFAATERIYAPVDGLAAENRWHGRMWINPGLRKINHGQWADRLLHEFTKGNVLEGLILLPACTNASYALKLKQFPRAFTAAPIKVSGPNLPEHTIKLPLMIVYVGPNERFLDFSVSFKTDLFHVFTRTF